MTVIILKSLVVTISMLVSLAVVIGALVEYSLLSESLRDIKADYGGWHRNVAIVSFDQFVRFYGLNSDKYDLDRSTWYPYRKDTCTHIIFDRKLDHVKYRIWQKRECKRLAHEGFDKSSRKATAEYLKAVMNDVENTRRVAKREYETAARIFSESAKEKSGGIMAFDINTPGVMIYSTSSERSSTETQ